MGLGGILAKGLAGAIGGGGGVLAGGEETKRKLLITDYQAEQKEKADIRKEGRGFKMWNDKTDIMFNNARRVRDEVYGKGASGSLDNSGNVVTRQKINQAKEAYRKLSKRGEYKGTEEEYLESKNIFSSAKAQVQQSLAAVKESASLEADNFLKNKKGLTTAQTSQIRRDFLEVRAAESFASSAGGSPKRMSHKDFNDAVSKIVEAGSADMDGAADQFEIAKKEGSTSATNVTDFINEVARKQVLDNIASYAATTSKASPGASVLQKNAKEKVRTDIVREYSKAKDINGVNAVRAKLLSKLKESGTETRDKITTINEEADGLIEQYSKGIQAVGGATTPESRAATEAAATEADIERRKENLGVLGTTGDIIGANAAYVGEMAGETSDFWSRFGKKTIQGISDASKNIRAGYRRGSGK